MDLVKNYELGPMTGYKTKGSVKYFKETKSIDELVEVLRYAETSKIPLEVFGGGTNILIKDNYEGLFVSYINNKLSHTVLDDGSVLVKAGSSVTKEDLVNYCSEKGYSGLEFWAGIPGLVGGGVAMNCGAYKSETKDVMHDIELCSSAGVCVITSTKMKWSYRSSGIHSGSVITSATFKLSASTSLKVKAQCDEYVADRKKKHPLEYPSCGSVFKNPSNSNKGAWELIKDAGLCGFRIGGAMISEKHSNFIINYDNAKAQDIIDIINEVKRIVRSKFGVELHEEIKIY